MPYSKPKAAAITHMYPIPPWSTTLQTMNVALHHTSSHHGKLPTSTVPTTLKQHHASLTKVGFFTRKHFCRQRRILLSHLSVCFTHQVDLPLQRPIAVLFKLAFIVAREEGTVSLTTDQAFSPVSAKSWTGSGPLSAKKLVTNFATSAARVAKLPREAKQRLPRPSKQRLQRGPKHCEP